MTLTGTTTPRQQLTANLAAAVDSSTADYWRAVRALDDYEGHNPPRPAGAYWAQDR